MKKVLLVAYYFPPIAATGAMRPLNFCQHLPSYGWAPSVLATDHQSALPSQAFDERLLDRVAASVQVTRVGHDNPLGRLLKFRDRWTRALKGQTGEAVLPSAKDPSPGPQCGPGKGESMFYSVRRFILDAWLNFPDPQCRWYGEAVRAMVRKGSGERPDVIWATGGPWTGLLVGKRLAQKWAIPFVADFRDPWMSGYEFFSSKLLHRRAAYLERAVCEAASCVVLNTEELRLRFCAEYPQWQQKFVAITNGYADELAPQGVLSGAAQNRVGALELCHFGTVYGNRSPLALFHAIQELMGEGVLDRTRLTLRFVGAWDVDDSACTQLAKSLEDHGVLTRIPPVPHQECLHAMRGADVLLILQPNYPLQVPAKIYEYITAGRPLFVLGGEGATANLVHRHRLGRCCPNRVQDVKQALIALIADRTSLEAPDPADTKQFSYSALSKRLAGVFDDVAGQASR